MQDIRYGQGEEIIVTGGAGRGPAGTLTDGGTVTLRPGQRGYAETRQWLDTYLANLAEARRLVPDYEPAASQ